MKRNITVNIFGSLYRMDEDAYAVLNAYIANMREYFSHQPDGKEIADDIEGRAAELMSELTSSGVEAISIEHVNDIIRRIGNPEEMTSDYEDTSCGMPEDAASEEDGGAGHPKRRLYRNPEHSVIAGVCSGLGCYSDINPLWIRLFFIILLIPSWGIAAAVYLLLWICLPLASTPAERLRMKGKSVNITNLCNEFLKSSRELLAHTSELSIDNNLTRRAWLTLKWCGYAIGVILAGFCSLLVFALIIAIICAFAAPWSDMRSVMGNDNPIIMVLDSNSHWLVVACCVSALVFLIVLLYAIIHTTLHFLGKVKPLNRILRVVFCAVGLVAFVVCIMTSIRIVSNLNIHFEGPWKAQREENWRKYEEEETRRQSDYLSDGGWTLTRSKGLNGKYFRKGEHYSGNDNMSYLDAGRDNSADWMEYEVVRSLKVAPGTYTLKAAVRANGTGARIYATDGKGNTQTADIPACGNKGGDIWNNARLALAADSLGLRPDRDYLKKIASTNDDEGYGWSEVRIDNITVGADSVLNYGVTTVAPDSSWEGSWLSATGFEVSRSGK